MALLTAICERLSHSGIDLDPAAEAAVSYAVTLRALKKGYPEQTGISDTWLDHCEAAARQALCRSLGDPPPPREAIEVPRVRLQDLEFADRSVYRKMPVPLVLEGAAADSEAVRSWTPAMFGERYGEFPCILSRSGASEQKRGTLGDVAAAVADNEFDGWYAHNIADLFVQHPALVPQLAIGKVARRFGSQQHFLTDLFFGGPGTKTGYHCAPYLNVFVNVYGEKEWVFAHPDATPLLYPEVDITGIFTNSPVDFTLPVQQQLASFPLYGHVPRYRTVLKPGDVLLNPPWWWHGVRNLTSATIACATRHVVLERHEGNPVLRAVSGVMPQARELLAQAHRDHSIQLHDGLTRDLYFGGDEAAAQS